MKVIRCENPLTKRGPYMDHTNPMSLISDFPWVTSQNDMTGLHPTPEYEFPELDYDTARHRFQCGFASLDQMYSWFTPEQRTDIVNKGYRFLWLRASGQVLIGKRQCLFHRPSAQVIGPVADVLV